MNTIIITTYNVEEWNKFNSNAIAVTIFDGENYGKISFASSDKQIVVIYGGVGNASIDTVAFLNTITSPKIVLYHQLDFNITPSFNVTTGRQDCAENRKTYKKLLDVKFAGAIDTDEKQKIFNEVWTYFSEENQKQLLERRKTDFLYHIYNGGKPSTFKEKDEIPNIERFKKLYEPFEGEGKQYNKQKDIDDDETQGAEQRQNLSLLRDALLANK